MLLHVIPKIILFFFQHHTGIIHVFYTPTEKLTNIKENNYSLENNLTDREKKLIQEPTNNAWLQADISINFSSSWFWYL